ncbi:hypothetical protein PR048_006295 [Dryococelus australis]|uniref:Transposase Tc1-like domain-containing protein n=1 Tax=Dryococelus australis TaxID=614101 RepID=A0ABQ9IBX0_9NEOP|nr:hypothetical protein PR048_006295 [Dryococelus australis]
MHAESQYNGMKILLNCWPTIRIHVYNHRPPTTETPGLILGPDEQQIFERGVLLCGVYDRHCRGVGVFSGLSRFLPCPHSSTSPPISRLSSTILSAGRSYRPVCPSGRAASYNSVAASSCPYVAGAATTRIPPRRSGLDSRRGRSPDFRMCGSCRTMPLVGEFSRGSPVSPALSSCCSSILTSLHLIGSQDPAVKSHPNLSNTLMQRHMRNAGRPRSVRTVRLEEVIRQYIDDMPSTSTRSIACQMGVSHSTVWDVLRLPTPGKGLTKCASLSHPDNNPQPRTWMKLDVLNIKHPSEPCPVHDIYLGSSPTMGLTMLRKQPGHSGHDAMQLSGRLSPRRRRVVHFSVFGILLSCFRPADAVFISIGTRL